MYCPTAGNSGFSRVSRRFWLLPYISYIMSGPVAGIAASPVSVCICEKREGVLYIMDGIRAIKEKVANEFLNPDSIKKLVRYLIVGISSFAVEYTLFVVFRELLPFHELVTNIMVYTIIFWFNFLLNKFFTFRSRKNFKKQLISYGILFFFNMVVGNILLFSAIKALLNYLFPTVPWVPYYLPKILIMVFIVSWNFILYKKVIYKD